jgi:hypothetical protein
VSYSRKIFLINPSFQLKLSLYISIIVFITGLIYPITINQIFDVLITKFNLSNPEIAAHYRSQRSDVILYLILMHFGFSCVTFCACIFFSHKIAGPMYKLQKYLKSVRDGEAQDRLFFRKGDYFLEIADDVNVTLEHIEETYKNDLVYLSEVNSYIKNLSLVVPDDKKIVLNEISTKLSAIQERFTTKQ